MKIVCHGWGGYRNNGWSWPKYVAELQGKDYETFSFKNASNETISRKVIDSVLELRSSISHLYVMWTGPEKYEVVQKDYVLGSESLVVKDQNTNFKVAYGQHPQKEKHEFYNKHFFNLDRQYYRTLEHILRTQQFLTSQSISFTMMIEHKDVLRNTFSSISEKRLYNEIDWSKFIFYDGKKGIKEFTTDYANKNSQSEHDASRLAQYYWAKNIILKTENFLPNDKFENLFPKVNNVENVLNDVDYKKQILDTKSASFCGAKWYNATIWLGSGMTTSCHHPLPHKIDLEEIKTNPSAIHNTKQKKEQRRQMQCGERPAGCEYCWKIEDMGRNAISDRVYKSKIFTNEDLHTAFATNHQANHNLKTLEIAFDRTCQFACTYCNPAFSTTWANDIKQKGPYTGLQSDGRNHFTHSHESAEPYKKDETNPYVEAFYKWWESDLHKTLDELRITGGEPMMSPNLWRLLDWIETQGDKINPNMRLAINTNLGAKKEIIERFKKKLWNFHAVDLYTSNESVFQQAEYIRDGMDFEYWYENLNDIILSGVPNSVHNMCTINALCLESLSKFLEILVGMKNHKRSINFTLNILRFPSFQSPLVLPDDLRNKFKGDIEKFLTNNEKWLEGMEIEHTKRLIDYLDVVKTPHAGAATQDKLQKDFKVFYSQYDTRRGKDFEKTFPIIGEWYRGI